MSEHTATPKDKGPSAAGPKVAMILAAGLGTRMRPLTDDRPKALVEVAGQALIDHVLDRVAAAGVSRAVVNVHWFADRLEAHLEARDRAPNIVFSNERDELLETGGGLKKARPLLGNDPIFVANIDSVWLDRGDALGDLIRLWDPDRMDAALLLARREGAIGFEGDGDFFLSPEDPSEEVRAQDATAQAGRLVFRGEANSAPYAYMGIHITRPDYVDQGPAGPFSLSGLWRRSAAAGRLWGCVMDGDWMHVGDPEARRQAEARLALTPRLAPER